MASPSTLVISIFLANSLHDTQKAFHQSSTSCSNFSRLGLFKGISHLPSAIALPLSSHAIAFVDCVELSTPITRRVI